MVDGVGGMVGPELTGIAGRPSPAPERWPSTGEYVRASILEPDAYVVPGYSADMPAPDSLGLTAEDVEAVWAYLMTLR